MGSAQIFVIGVSEGGSSHWPGTVISIVISASWSRCNWGETEVDSGSSSTLETFVTGVQEGR